MLTVWGRSNSSNVKKVLWCLEELALPYKQIPAGGEFGVIHDAEYLALNPNGLVPCLQDSQHDLVLWESNAIVRYLAAEYGQDSLWQAAPADRARGDKWMDWASTTLAPHHLTLLFNLIRMPEDQRDDVAIARSKVACEALFWHLENALTEQTWLSGDAFGPADITLGCLIYNLFNISLSWPPLPYLQAWYEQLTLRAAFQRVVMIPVT